MADIYDLQIDLNADTSHSRAIRLTGLGKRVLDVGCATGYISRILTDQFGCHVTGIEANPEAAAKARLRCQRVICDDVETLDFAPFGGTPSQPARIVGRCGVRDQSEKERFGRAREREIREPRSAGVRSWARIILRVLSDDTPV